MDPQINFPFNIRYSINFKLLVVGALIFICLVPTFFVGFLLSERENRQKEVIGEIADRWGLSQVVAGPVLFLPYRTVVVDGQGVRSEKTGVLNVLPNTLTYDAVVDPEIRSRGIFDAIVYKSLIKGSGTFTVPDLSYLAVLPNEIQWDKAYVAIGITDTRGITEQVNLQWNGSPVHFEPGSKNNLVGDNGIHAFVPLKAGGEFAEFAFAFNVQGSEELAFAPLGSETKVHVRSGWNSPSFIGAYLPAEHAVANGFSADWSVSSFGRSYPQQWLDREVERQTLMDSTFGVSLIQSVDFYTMISRTIKYAIMFIAITFMAFFLFEILSKLKIHPFQYLLVGFALALFFLLLLSLSERFGFLAAYAISTIAIIGLITSYSAKVLRAHKKALTVAALLFLLYSYLYVIVQLEDLALLYGSILLFMLLALTMYLTRNIDWYRIETGEQN
ncbi:MAG: cell envelope integrity protein CreD [bacterium]|nr:cell envelope integrity protein CreD [bacterium]MDP3963775.1 cell envelope integrity protein CreD [bacterium]